MSDVAHELQTQLAGTNISAIPTVLVKLDDLAVRSRSAEIASIVTQGDLDRIYLIVVTEVEPRRELSDTDALCGALELVQLVEAAGVRVLQGFVSSDVCLWKSAGASDCATGKFFNLRRFTQSRFEPPAGGGGQIPYWFDEGLMAFVRQSDLIRLRRAGLLADVTASYPASMQILDKLDAGAGDAWLAESWLQYMAWCADFEARMQRGITAARQLLRNAERTWARLEDEDILMEERANDGAWLRSWRRTIAEFGATGR